MSLIEYRSFRAKLQASFILLGLAAIGITGWEASAGATSYIRQATFDRLSAVCETRARQLQRYFEDLQNHVVALSTDESTITALEAFEHSWNHLPPTNDGDTRDRELREFYQAEHCDETRPFAGPASFCEKWYPQDLRTRTLQYLFLAANSHPRGTRDLLLKPPQSGPYGDVHARFHPTFHRYQHAFGFYDILLISKERIFYSVLKESDLGFSIQTEPFRSTTVARAHQRALTVQGDSEAVLEDYASYPPSHFAPAAFAAAPVRRAGVRVGVLAIQVSIREVNRVMTGDRMWEQEGLGKTGQAYIVGPDSLLRSDFRAQVENPQEFLRQLEQSGVDRDILAKVRAHNTSVLTLPVNLETAEEVRRGGHATGTGSNLRGIPVLRSHAPIQLAGLNWTLVAEIESGEAFAPLAALQRRILTFGLIISAVFFVAAGWLARSITRPMQRLEQNVRLFGSETLGMQVPVESSDEIGQLTRAFNRMSEDLRKTTVSKSELETLAGRLISAQEEERSRIARELHDDLSQRVAAVTIEAGRLEKLTDSSASDLRVGLERLKQQAARIAEDVHGISRHLHPAILNDLGMTAAVEAECRGVLERGGPWVDLSMEGDWYPVPRDVQLAIYRIVQESLRNAHRHSGVNEVILRLAVSEAAASLQVQDHGRGFDRTAADWQPGIGLASMEERTRLLGGTFQIQSRPGEGTEIRVTIPIRKAYVETQALPS